MKQAVLSVLAFVALGCATASARQVLNPAAAAFFEKYTNEKFLSANYKLIDLFVVNPIFSTNSTVTAQSVRNHAEVRLKASGLTPVDITAHPETSGQGLEIEVLVSDETCVIEVRFNRDAVWSTGAGAAKGIVTTWRDRDITILRPNGPLFMDALDKELDVFLKAYLKANQPAVK